MTVYYNGIHSVKFGAYDSWKDFHLIPVSRPVINPPLEKTKFVDIPGRSGKLDLSWALTEGPVYDNRTGSIEFYVDHNQWKDWITAYNTILEALQGKRIQVVLSDDPDYYYEGLCYVDKWTSDERSSKITIKYDLSPFKQKTKAGDTSWSWDPLNIGDGKRSL